MNDLLARCFPLLRGGVAVDDSMQRLAALLDVSPEEIQSIPTDRRLTYREFSIRKKSGSRRRIFAPSSTLKLLQRRLLHCYLEKQAVHEAATAFRSGSSIATHAQRHMAQAILLTVDLADFFPCTAAARMRRWFVQQGWQGASLAALMRLCVYRGGLPQGAPTSPALSNLVNVDFDRSLCELAALHGARYSRYCDDLAFSWGGEVEPGAFRCLVEDRLHRFGYRIQPAKGWRLQRLEDRPEIVGLVIAGRRLRLPERVLRRIRKLRLRWFARTADEEQQLQGYRGLEAMIRGLWPY